MSNTSLMYPVETIQGKIHRKGNVIFRQKQFKDEKGKVFAQGTQETYLIQNPRDWKANPPTEAELHKINLWKQACAQTKVIVRKPEEIENDPTLSDEAKSQALATSAMWKRRFAAQRAKGEADAPINPQTGKRTTYQRFDCFVRAVLLRELQKGE